MIEKLSRYIKQGLKIQIKSDILLKKQKIWKIKEI